MILNEYIEKLLERFDTKKNRTEETSGNRNFKLSRLDREKYNLTDLIETLEYLEKNLPKEYIKIKWQYSLGTKKSDINSFTIRLEALNSLYALIGKDNPRNTLSIAKNIIQEKLDKCSINWLKSYYEAQLKHIENGTLPADYNDDKLDMYLYAVITNTEPIFLRAFSSKYGNSKEFEGIKTGSNKHTGYKSKIASIIKKYNTDLYYTYHKETIVDDTSASELSDNDILRAFNIFTYSIVFEFKGALEYEIDGTAFSSKGHTSGYMLNTDSLYKAKILSLKGIKRIVTIENKANYYAQEYDDETLYIYVHGFLSPAETRLLKQIIEKFEGTEVYHFGDLDWGGMRIFNFLRERISSLFNPLYMDADTYIHYLNNFDGEALSDKEIKNLQKYKGGVFDELIDLMCKYRYKYEQEKLLFLSGIEI